MKKNLMKMDNNDYKKELGITLQGIGSLLGITREAVRQKLERHTRWRMLAQKRLALLGEARAEISRLEQHLAANNLKEMTADEADIKVKEMAWREIQFSSVRAMHACERLNITSLDSLLEFGLDRFAVEYAVGKKTMADIRQILFNHKILPVAKPGHAHD